MAPATRAAIVTCYARWLVWLKRSHREALDLPPAARATEQRFLAYVHAMTDEIALLTLIGYATRLQSALKLIAPETDWTWMTAVIRRIERRARQEVSSKPPFVPSNELYAFGVKLMNEAEAGSNGDARRRAEAFRDGLAIALLASRPLRRVNFIGLRLGEHMTRTSAGWRVSIPAEQTKVKTGPGLEFMIPAGLAGQLERYLAEHRVVLAEGEDQRPRDAGECALWLGRSGAAWPSDTFADMISRRTLERFGLRLTPHDFRHCAATSIAEHSPEEHGIIRVILGHTTGATAERHYIHAGMVNAARRHQQVLKARREAA